ncbi:MAG: hypothetical protein U1E17_02770 [Geminicoccaceae bacterium]
MARGRRSDRAGPASSGTARSPLTPDAGDGTSPLDAYEEVEFEEVDPHARPALPPAAAGAVPPTDRTEDHVMSQPEEPSATTVPEPGSPAVASAEPPRRGGGFLPGLLGGLLGTAAVLGGGGWYAYQNGPIQPTLARLAATEQAAQATQGGIADLGKQLTQLQGTLGNLRTSLDGVSGSLAKLDQRLTADEQRLATTEGGMGDLKATVDQASTSFRKAGEEVIGRLEAVNAKLVEVEKAQPADIVDKGTVEGIAGKQAGIDAAQAKLEGGLARLEQLVAQGLEAANQQGAALRTVADSNRSQIDTIGREVHDLEALKDQVAQHEAAHAEHRAALAQVGTQIASLRDGLQEQLQGVATKLSDLDKQRERSVAMSIAVDSLRTALQAGAPYVQPLDELSQLGQADTMVQDAVAKLQPMATAGVPTQAALVKQLAGVEQTLAAAATAAQSQDWFERTRANLQGLVDLHAAGAEDVPGRKAVTAAGQALAQQDLKGAIAAMTPLAQSGNAAAKAWLDAANARVVADETVDGLRQHVKTLLAHQD